MEERRQRNRVANLVAQKLVLLEERMKLAERRAHNLLERKEIEEDQKDVIRCLLDQMIGWWKESEIDSIQEEDLEKERLVINELMAEMAYLSEKYDYIGISENDNRVLKLCSEYGSHVLPLPKSYSALMEMVDQFYGSPEDEGFVYVVSCKDIHISGDFELEYVYESSKDVQVISLLVTTARSSKRRRKVSVSPPSPSSAPADSVLHRPWIRSEQRLLDDAICKFGIEDWEIIARHVKTRTAEACRARYRRQRIEMAQKEVPMPIVKDFASSHLNFSKCVLAFSKSHDSHSHQDDFELVEGSQMEEQDNRVDSIVADDDKLH